jgi:hypothetical protein
MSALGSCRKGGRELGTYIVAGLLVLVALLVLRGLGLVGAALLLVQGLPSLAEDLADLA